jgi:hypothetical protein
MAAKRKSPATAVKKKAASAPKAATARTPSRKTTSAKPKVAAAPARPKEAAQRRSGVARKPPVPRPRKSAAKARAAAAPGAPFVAAGLTEEERIEAAKYLPRDLPKRLFEEERFLFPESYGITRVRLLIKDPEWLFVHWDVNPKTLKTLAAELGERVLALTRLTLRIADPDNGGAQTILLPAGSRSWYVRADTGRSRAYNAELGLTLPSGEFRTLAVSNTVVTPRVGPSPEPASARRRVGALPAPASRPRKGAVSEKAPVRSSEGSSEPWRPVPEHADGTEPGSATERAERGQAKGSKGGERGGASDAFGPGGASETHRR